MTVRAPL